MYFLASREKASWINHGKGHFKLAILSNAKSPSNSNKFAKLYNFLYPQTLFKSHTESGQTREKRGRKPSPLTLRDQYFPWYQNQSYHKEIADPNVSRALARKFFMKQQQTSSSNKEKGLYRRHSPQQCKAGSTPENQRKSHWWKGRSHNHVSRCI